METENIKIKNVYQGANVRKLRHEADDLWRDVGDELAKRVLLGTEEGD